MEKQILEELKEIKNILMEHSRILGSHSQKLDIHGETLKEHGLMLSALRTGQEELKAELDGMKIQNAKEFGELKESLKNTEASIQVLKDETFINKTDIYRLKNTVGIK